jgi:hypothetical protein
VAYGYDVCTVCNQRAPLCDACLERSYQWQWSTAYVRGERWAECTLQALGDATQPWPDTPKAHAIAARSVRDLTDDERLRERLAKDYHASAARLWEHFRTVETIKQAVLRSRLRPGVRRRKLPSP